MSHLSEYDVIVVGAGNAGAVVASRLSENAAVQVLLVEAGADHSANPQLHVPAAGMMLWPDPNINWNYYTVPQEQYDGRSVNHPRGKGLGGSTLVNLNCMTFPDRGSIDNWAKLGNDDWTFNNLQPYYRKFHTWHEPGADVRELHDLDYLNPELHGKDGPVQVTFGTYSTPHTQAWVKTFDNLGYKAKADILSGDLQGAYHAPGTVNPESSTRSYSAAAYLTKEVVDRKNLTILASSLVERVLFDSRDPIPRASGVQIRAHGGEQIQISAKKEVIICCGVFKSPQLLELSGIGKPDLLKRNNIDVLVDLPGVGENLQDHANVGVSFESTVPTLDAFRDPAVIGQAFGEYSTTRSGPFSSSIYSQAFMPCLNESSQVDITELKEVLDGALDVGSISPGLRRQYEIIRQTVQNPKLTTIQLLCAPIKLQADQTSAAIPEEAQQKDFVTIFASLSHPFSRGTCHITSADPSVEPAIDPKYFSHPADVELEAQHLRYVRTLIKTKPLADLVNHDGLTIPADLDLKSIESTRKLVRSGFTTYHPCGTCSMLPREDGGVVDSRLRVYGVQNLRVVDASIFPLIPRGNIQSSVYAVAERAADILKQDLA